jgi:hypothetical protein
MASELCSGAPASDWGAGLPADVMGKIGSLLTDFTDGSLRTVEDELTRYNRKDVACKRLVSRI